MEYEEKKKKGNLPFVKTWMNLEGIIKLSETETKKNTECSHLHANQKKMNSQKQKVAWWLVGEG